MNANDYKKAVQMDVQQLNYLELEIMPALHFYREMAYRALCLFLFIVVFPWMVTLLIKGDAYPLGFYITDVLILSVLFFVTVLFFLPQLAGYITFKETIKPHLELGNLIDAKFRLYFKVAMVVYLVWSTTYTWLFLNLDFSHWGERLFTLVPGVLLGVFIASIIFQIDIARVGIGTLFEAITSLKNRQGNIPQ